MSSTECDVKNKSNDYVKRFIARNKDRLKEKILCPICNNTYTYFNKSKHNKTKLHLTVLSLLKTNKVVNIEL
jgi:hypothetical protein